MYTCHAYRFECHPNRPVPVSCHRNHPWPQLNPTKSTTHTHLDSFVRLFVIVLVVADENGDDSHSNPRLKLTTRRLSTRTARRRGDQDETSTARERERDRENETEQERERERDSPHTPKKDERSKHAARKPRLDLPKRETTIRYDTKTPLRNQADDTTTA